MFEKIKTLRNIILHVDSRTIYLYSFVIGCVTGSLAIAFHTCIYYLNTFLFDRLAHFPLEESVSILASSPAYWLHPRYLLVILLPAFGGLLVGLGTHFLDQDSKGTGVDKMLESFHQHSGQLRKRTPFVKFFTSTMTLSTGGSAGKEGPMALIGAGMGSLLARFLKMGARAKRTLLLAGAAGGLGAIFRAPLGGAITAVEVLYKEDFETDALLPSIISSVTAYTIYSAAVGFSHQLRFQTNIFHSPIELIFYVFLGFFCSGAAFVFVKIFRESYDKFFNQIPLNKILLPALGGLFIGIMALLMPQSIGEGIGIIQKVIDGQYPQNWILGCLFLITLAFLKMLSSTFTIQSGGSGGILIPSLFIGAMLGGFFGTFCHHFFPNQIPSVTPYIIVGMAAFFSSVTNASLGALIMVTEMTGGYELLPPLMIVGVISLITTHKISIYKNQVNNKFSSQAHLWDMNPKNLQYVTIGSAFRGRYHRKAVIDNRLNIDQVEKIMEEIQQTDLIVEDAEKKLVGLLSWRDFASAEEDLKHSKEVLVAGDLIHRQTFFVSEQDTLYEAMRFLMDTDFDKVPVVRKEDDRPVVLGYLRHQDIVRYYYRMGLQYEEKLATEA